MPVIRGEMKWTVLTNNQRKALLKSLVSELAGKSSPNGPVIYEIPLELSDRVDILVVWDEFRELRSEDRTTLILDAYKDRKAKIAQALGVTREEALQQYLLLYEVKPISHSGFAGVDMGKVRKAMLEEGGFPLGEDRIALRFPTQAMAEEASHRLMQQVPQVTWYIEQVNS
ncbi:MAG: hypothetical protein HYX68_08215 [Planctomycetes bacterium]|jgi:hypothetical protein|nr:hypothetical protein [Planctomycetota bacterium]